MQDQKITFEEIAQNDVSSYLKVVDIKRLRNNMYKSPTKCIPPNS